jgi:hydroxysqualene synthase
VSVDHYENFPVASLLCPPRLRPPIVAIYHFARTADDLADEGDAPAALRLKELAAYRQALLGVGRGNSAGLAGRAQNAESAGRAQGTLGAYSDATADAPFPAANGGWPQVFGPLAEQIKAWSLPLPPLHHLLDAFEQDVRNPAYPLREELLAYCALSANPVGRLLLHLWGIDDARSQHQSDCICSALQLINFWQDLSVDLPRARYYVPLSDLTEHGLTNEQLMMHPTAANARALVRSLCAWAQALMLEGAPLPLRVPGRAGWELRLVVQGGLRILEKIAAMDHTSAQRRPTLSAADGPVLLWRAWRAGHSHSTP